MKEKILTCILCLNLMLTASGCSGHPQSKRNVGIIVYDDTDTFLTSWVNQYIKDAAEYNLNVSTAGAHRSQLTENKLVKDMIEDGADILCINLVDRTSTSDIIKAAENADIPVIFFNREPVESDLNRWNELYYVGADAAESGRYQGEIALTYMKDHPETDLNGDGIVQYYVLEGETGHQDAIIRSESSVEALETAGIPLAKIGYSICNWNKSEAYNEVTRLIQENTPIELLLCNNDEMASGAVQAYDDNEIPIEERPITLGIDGTKTGLKLVQNKKMAGTVFNDYIAQADAALTMTVRLLQKQDLSDLNLKDGKSIYLPYQKITYENVEVYLQRIS